MTEDPDFVARYALACGFALRPRTVLVEGTSDVDLFDRAAVLEFKASGRRLIDQQFSVVAAGEGDRGGTNGVIRELVTLRSMAARYLLPSGRPRYRVAGLFDGDAAGSRAVSTARTVDRGILEYRDVFRLRPAMPAVVGRDPTSLGKVFDVLNSDFKGLEWELEDLLGQDLVTAFLLDEPGCVKREQIVNGKTHREWTRDGKARLHRFALDNAMHEDLSDVISVLCAIRGYLGLST